MCPSHLPIWSYVLGCSIIDSSRQQLTIKVEHNNQIFHLTTVYARTEAVKRSKLWRKLTTINNPISGPWCILDDFNSIMAPGEKRGGVPHVLSESMDFISCMNKYGMKNLGFTENSFTWCNRRRKRKRISKRLDRVLINDAWADVFHLSKVDHHAKTGSDHSLLTFEFGNTMQEATKYFRFLNFWKEHSGYFDLMQDIWSMKVHGNAQWILQ
ncbi:hypothetical protein P3L10_009541 [Capsicum annuum]|uniref:uncharacterized protein LOC107865050 n=1 Tax=Capsicum annuum TaxID=4072 RepID=UPI0007BEB608|nr:uncharacterized protein LOC107865050 [Capsicum annuum]